MQRLADDQTLTGTLVTGCQLSNRLRECTSGLEARALIFAMSEADLRAVVTANLFGFQQQRLGPDSYSAWQR